jgi:hypothetical protein
MNLANPPRRESTTLAASDHTFVDWGVLKEFLPRDLAYRRWVCDREHKSAHAEAANRFFGKN